MPTIDERIAIALRNFKPQFVTTIQNLISPAAHAATHADGGSDPVDVTSLDGFPGGTSDFLREDGTFATPPGGGTPSATVAALDGTGAAGSSTDYSRGDHKHADANRPSDDEKDALAGTGTPSAANPYVNDDDPRLGSGVGGLGGLVLLEQHTASNSASLDFTSCITSAYDTYRFEFVGVRPATDGTFFFARLSTDGGSTYDSSAIYSVDQLYWRAGDGGPSGSGGNTQFYLSFYGAQGVSNGATRPLTGWMELYDPLSTAAHKTIEGQTRFFNTASGGFRFGVIFFQAYESTTAVNAVQFFFGSGNITSGTIRCYGYAK